MTGQMTAEALREQLVLELLMAGRLTSSSWTLDGVRDVARHLLLTCTYREAGDGKWEALHPDAPTWLRMIYSDRPLVVQLDGDEDRWVDALDGPVTGTPTAIANAPSKVACMLDALDVDPLDVDDLDHETRAGAGRVLVAGVADPYVARMLTYRLGRPAVHVVEPDAAVAHRARHAFKRLGGEPPLIVCGDPATDLPTRAPYARVIATQPVTGIPPAWIRHTTPGGVIVAALDMPLAADPVVKLTVGAGGTASGRFLRDEGRRPWPIRTIDVDQLDARNTDQRMASITGLTVDARLVAALMMRDVGVVYEKDDTWFVDRAPARDRSWARYEADTGVVLQHGPRRLWDEVESAVEIWTRAGCPRRDQVHLTVTSTGEHQFALETGAPLWTYRG